MRNGAGLESTFFSRFLGFTCAFYAGSVGAIFTLTIVKTATFFPVHFWSWLMAWMQGDVLPVALAELFRSPLMGLLFASVGSRVWSPKVGVRFGLACGLLSYTVAYSFSVLRSVGGEPARAVERLNLTEITLLGLPVALVFLERAWPVGRSHPIAF